MQDNKPTKIKKFFSTVFYVLKELPLVGIVSKYEDLKTKGWRVGTRWGLGTILIFLIHINLSENTLLKEYIIPAYLIIGMIYVLILTIHGILQLRNKK